MASSRGWPRSAWVISGRTRVFAILGDPVSHSLSPAMHNAAFHALGLEAKDVSARFDEGEVFIGSLDGDVLAGYDWYRTRPISLEQGAVCFCFDQSFICSAYSFVRPSYRGRSLSADRWDFAHREFSARGWRGTVYYIETRNFSSLQAAARRHTAQWVGQIAYIRVMGRYIRWTSRGCRQLGIHLSGGNQLQLTRAAGAREHWRVPPAA